MGSILALPVCRPRLTIAIFLTLALLAAAGAARLQFSSDIRVFFGDENPQLQAYEALEQTYSQDNSILFVVSTKEGGIFAPATLASLAALTEAAWQIPYSRRVDSLTNFQHTFARDDDLVVQPLVRDVDRLDAAAVAAIEKIALSEPLLVNRLIAADGKVAGINVPIVLPGKDPLLEQPEAVAYARKIAADAEAADPNLRVQLTGIVMINNALAEAGTHDMQTLIPLMLLVVLVLIAVQIKSIAGTLVTLLVILLSIAIGMGVAGWLGIRLSPPVVSASNIIMTLAVADAVHVLTTFLNELRAGKSRAQAMTDSLKVNASPVFLTSITTFLGFLSMNASDSPPFRDLGNIVAGGVVAAWALSMFLLPALMMTLPLRARKTDDGGSPAMERLADFVVARRRPLLIGMSALSLAMLACIPLNRVNDEFVKYYSKNLDFRVATDFAIERLTGFEFFAYNLKSGAPGGIHDPAYLNAVEDFANWFRRQPEAKHVYAITDVMKRLNMNMHGDDPAFYKVPDDRELAAQYLLLYELSLPFGLDMNDRISIDKSATLMHVSLDAITTNDMLALEQRAADWLAANAPASMQEPPTGQSVMFAHIGQKNIASLLTSSAVALALISFLLIFALRSVKFGLLSLIPNLAPAALAFGVWGLFVGEVGLALSVVVGMTIGIVVDDSIHFLSKYLRARREQGLDPEAAVRYAFVNVGQAMWITSVVLVAGFGVLMFSDFQINSGMGLLSAVTIAVALAADYFLLPPLLMLVDRTKEPPRHA